jgi:hypothetical protein
LIFAFAFRSAPQFRHAATLDLSRHTLPTPGGRRRIFISLFSFTLPITTVAASFITISRAGLPFHLTPPAIALNGGGHMKVAAQLSAFATLASLLIFS